MRKLIQVVLLFLFRTLTRLEVIGQENIPPSGGCLLVGNHLGILDGPLYLAVIPRQDATGLAADKHKRNFLFRWVVNRVNGIWIDRDTTDFHALRQAVAYLKRGGLLGIAPEGTRSQTHQLIRAKEGAAFLAAQAGDIPIVPAAVTGTETAVQQLLHLRRSHLRVVFGKPFFLPRPDRKDRDAALRRNTDEIMCQIAALLPQKYRGVYANHPRLIELLTGTELNQETKQQDTEQDLAAEEL
jgi:1-acyl-sn-glycerol-3-phosphate acyltransferase